MSSPVIRCFWAVRPPDETLEQVDQLVQVLKRPLSSLGLQVAWTARASYHFTVKFLGNVAEERLGELVAQVKAQLCLPALATAPRLGLAGLGVFPEARRPHVVYIEAREVGGPDPAAPAAVPSGLLALHGLLQSCHAPLGYAPEQRPFHPHLTIGRVRSTATEHEAALQALLSAYAPRRYGAPFAIDSLILYESQSTPSGPKYTPLTRLPLYPAGPAT